MGSESQVDAEEELPCRRERREIDEATDVVVVELVGFWIDAPAGSRPVVSLVATTVTTAKTVTTGGGYKTCVFFRHHGS